MLFTICLLLGYLLQCFYKKPWPFCGSECKQLIGLGVYLVDLRSLTGEAVRLELLWIILTLFFAHKLLSRWSLTCFYLGFLCWQNEDMDKQHQAELFSLMRQTVSVDFHRKTGLRYRTWINYAQHKRQSWMGLWHSQTWLVAMFYYI